MLEARCFKFGNEIFPDLMKQRKWLDAESVELARWIRVYEEIYKLLPPNTIDMLEEMTRLCLIVVNRISIDMAETLDILEAAVKFAEMIKGSEEAATILEMKKKLQRSRETIDQQQGVLKYELLEELVAIKRQKSILRKKEDKVIREMQELDEKQQAQVFRVLAEDLLENKVICTSCAQTQAVIMRNSKLEEGAVNAQSLDSSSTKGIHPRFT